jgi:drug/metabolite transporter (DMT)-like permease
MQVNALANSNQRRNAVIMIAAFAAVYIIWGSTYLAIKYAIDTIPPLLMAGVRFLSAGAVLMIWARFTADYEKPKPEHWRSALIVGTLLLLFGNGGVVFAERYISSSLAALLVAIEPFWVVILSWVWLRSSRPNLKVVLGLLAGFLGVWLLINGHGPSGAGAGSMQLWATLALVGATFFWAAGSIFGLRAAAPKSAIQTAGMQMLAGGAVLLVVSALFGEWSGIYLSHISRASLYGLAYLVLFGSIIGFTAYSWLLRNAPPPIVATYAYVNPIVAVLLGWLIAGETFTGQMLIGAGVIVGSVVLITSQEKDEDKFSSESDDLMTTGGAAAGNQRAARASA